MTESNQATSPAETDKPKTAPKTEASAQTAPKNAQAKSKTPLLAIFISILTLVIVAVAAFFFWQTLSQQSASLEQKIDSSLSEAQSFKPSIESLLYQVRVLNDASVQQQTMLKTLSEESYFHSQRLTDLGARSRNDWLLAEAEYLMRLANQRLHLEQDILSAEAMLTSADKIVSEINDPGLVEIRKTLANEIVSLQQVKHLDYQGLFLKLDAIITSLDKINQASIITQQNDFANDDPIADEVQTENVFLQIWSSIWQDLKQAVIIRRLDQPVEPLLAPEQEYYLKQNLRLMLEQASLALIDQNTTMYQTSLKKALNWIDRYFSQDDVQIAAITQNLSNMANFEIDRELPDISGSLRLIKAKIDSFYKQHSLSKLSTPDQEIKAQTEPQNQTKLAAPDQTPLSAPAPTSGDRSSQGAAL